MIGVTVGYNYGVERLGAESGPVGEDEGARSRVDVHLGFPLDEADASGASALGDHGEAASTGAEEVDSEGGQGYCLS